MILFSIGSVQDFIIDSRKVEDLYNSSSILSDLIKKGISILINHNNGKLVLPCLNVERDNIPNYFIIEYKSDESMGQNIEKQLRDYYYDNFAEIISNITITDDLKEQGKKQLKEQGKKQLRDALDIYWVDYELQNGEGIHNNYKEIYKKLYRYFDGVKNYKPIKVSFEEGKKCTICGKRNAIFIGKNLSKGSQYIYNYNYLKENSLFLLLGKLENNISINKIKNIIKDRKENYLCIDNKIDENKEMLCSVCYFKRLYNKEMKIPSTAEISVSSWLRKVKDDEDYTYYENTFKEFYKITKDDKNLNTTDKASFRYTELWDSINTDDEKSSKLLKKLKDAFEKLQNKNITKYFCIYRMDIDNLGKWMSGEYKEDDAVRLYEYQKELSCNINNFFMKIRSKIDQENLNDILLVYAGGDDMLVLLPVDEIYEFIKIIRDEFLDNVAIVKSKYENITYSEGIFITHYKTPLGEVIRASKEEIEKLKNRFKEKKNFYDVPKNGTVVSIMNEGYELRSVYYKKNIKYCLEDDDSNYFIFKYLINKFCGEFTFFHNELEMEFMDFEKNLDDSIICDFIAEMLEVEQKRWIKRSIIKKKINKKIDKNQDEKIKAFIDELNCNLISFLKANCKGKYTIDLENYFNIFHIIRKLKLIINGGVNIENITDKAER
jgi:CRISPR-associated protein Cmr2